MRFWKRPLGRITSPRFRGRLSKYRAFSLATGAMLKQSVLTQTNAEALAKAKGAFRLRLRVWGAVIATDINGVNSVAYRVESNRGSRQIHGSRL